jgi:hypothetical protein
MRMEAVVAYFKVYPNICLEGLSKTTKTSIMITSLRAEIRNRDLNTKQVWYLNGKCQAQP